MDKPAVKFGVTAKKTQRNADGFSDPTKKSLLAIFFRGYFAPVSQLAGP
jgi:hypothetical protein